MVREDDNLSRRALRLYRECRLDEYIDDVNILDIETTKIINSELNIPTEQDSRSFFQNTDVAIEYVGRGTHLRIFADSEHNLAVKFLYQWHNPQKDFGYENREFQDRKSVV